MKRFLNMDEISDGKLYDSGDLVHIGCDGCGGNADCCRNTDDTILLDPYDIYSLELATHLDFGSLYGKYINLRVVDGIILPYLMKSDLTGACVFLGSEGRCTIHKLRPGFCRLFPLGRIYNETGFKYFIQIHDCPCEHRPKIEIKKWLEIPNLKQYEEFIFTWNSILEKAQKEALTIAAQQNRTAEDAAKLQKISMQILTRYYLAPFDTAKDFYEQFDSKKNQ